MSEWWTYHLSDFLMFAPRTYYRLFELYNAAIWPLQLAMLALGMVALGLLWRDTRQSARIIGVILAAAWFFVGWAYHWRRFATINWGAEYYAAGFVLQAVLLIAFAALGRMHFRRPAGAAGGIALMLVAAGLLYPLVAPLAGRPWNQSEAFGIAPDPTAIATLGVLLLAGGRARWVLMVLPVLWCAISATTLWTMETAEALIPGAAVAAVIVTTWRSRQQHVPDDRLHRAKPSPH